VLSIERDGQKLYFCSDHCRQNFLSTPAIAKHEEKPQGNAIYTCPSLSLQRTGYSNSSGGALPVLWLAAQSNHCRRRDEFEFRLGHRQRLAATESEALIYAKHENKNAHSKTVVVEVRFASFVLTKNR